ncbi:MAG: SRPBCC family protein, partial [Nanoarchaeota archaeon]
MKEKIKTKNIRQSVNFKAEPHYVYEALMDSKKHSQFTKAPARISRKVGGKFTAYGDWIEGKNLKLVKDKKIVQKWRGKDWPKGHYSETTFELKPHKNGTLLVFTQKGVPTEHYKGINSGWKEHYWVKMRK